MLFVSVMHPFLVKAATHAVKRRFGDKRNFLLAAIGVAPDGRIFKTRNLAFHYMDTDFDDFRPEPAAHAEFKLCRALPYGSTVFVSRVQKNGTLALAKPCPMCTIALRSKRVKRVYYSIDDSTYGVMEDF